MKLMLLIIIVLVFLFSKTTFADDKVEFKGPLSLLFNQANRFYNRFQDQELDRLYNSHYSMYDINRMLDRYNDRCVDFNNRKIYTIGKLEPVIDSTYLTLYNDGKIRIGGLNFLYDDWMDQLLANDPSITNKIVKQEKAYALQNRKLSLQTMYEYSKGNKFEFLLKPNLNIRADYRPDRVLSSFVLDLKFLLKHHDATWLILNLNYRYRFMKYESVFYFKIEWRW